MDGPRNRGKTCIKIQANTYIHLFSGFALCFNLIFAAAGRRGHASQIYDSKETFVVAIPRRHSPPAHATVSNVFPTMCQCHPADSS